MQHPGVTLNKLGSLHLKKSLPTQPFDSWFPAGWRLCCLAMQVLVVLSWLSLLLPVLGPQWFGDLHDITIISMEVMVS